MWKLRGLRRDGRQGAGCATNQYESLQRVAAGNGIWFAHGFKGPFECSDHFSGLRYPAKYKTVGSADVTKSSKSAKHIESVLNETRSFAPPPEFTARARLKAADLAQLH